MPVVTSPTSSPSYAWRDLQFAPPAGLEDTTLVTFASADGSFNLNVSRDALVGSVEAYARAEENALKAQRPKGYVLDDVKGVPAAGDVPATAIHTRSLAAGDGQTVLQIQSFVAVSSAVVAIVTVTGRPARRNAMQDAMSSVVSSLRRT